MQAMLDHARRAASLVEGNTRPELESDWVASAALIRQLEVTGEAASRVSPATRAELTDIPWRSIVGMRNRLIHGYDVVGPDAIWRTATEDVPALIEQLIVRLRSGEDEQPTLWCFRTNRTGGTRPSFPPSVLRPGVTRFLRPCGWSRRPLSSMLSP